MMRFKNIASIFALAVLSLQAGCSEAAPTSDTTLLATTERIHACINETAATVTMPQASVEQKNGFIKQLSETEHMQAFIRIGVDGYRSDDPNRKTDQVNFFANYATEGVDGPIQIYRAKQISFDTNTFYPYEPNETGHAFYGHRQEIEYGRNFTPTAQETIIEEWVYSVVEAMDRNFKTCMGFETEGPDITVPEFPELITP